MSTPCAGCTPTCAADECEDCRHECDEGDFCHKHEAEDFAYWADYFRGMSTSTARLMTATQGELTEMMAEARRLK